MNAIPKKLLAFVLAFMMVLSMIPTTAFAAEPASEEATTPTKGYTLTIYNADGTEGKIIDGTKSVSAFCMKSAIEDARVFANNAFLFGLKTPCTYEVVMHEDSTENESFEIGADVTIIGNGHKIVCAEGVTVTNKGVLINATIQTPVTEPETKGIKIVILDKNGNETISLDYSNQDPQNDGTLIGESLQQGIDYSMFLFGAEGPFTYKLILQQDIEVSEKTSIHLRLSGRQRFQAPVPPGCVWQPDHHR